MVYIAFWPLPYFHTCLALGCGLKRKNAGPQLYSHDDRLHHQHRCSAPNSDLSQCLLACLILAPSDPAHCLFCASLACSQG